MAGRIAYYGNIVTDGLVLNLDAARKDSYNRTGTNWNDTSGNGNNGTLTNGPTFDSEDYGSIVFDGTDDRVDMVKNGLSNGNQPFSVCSWVNTSKTTRELFFGLDDESHLDLNAYNVNGSTLSFHKYNTFVMYAPVGSITTGSIQHVVWTYNGTVMNEANAKMYVNGVMKTGYQFSYGNAGSSYNFDSNIPNFISNKYPAFSSAANYTGSVYTTQLYNKPLTPFDVWQNFNAYKSRYGIPDIVTDGLVLNLDAGNPYSYLSGSSGTTWTNTVPASSSISGTLENGTTYSNGAMVFDGVDDYVDCGNNSTVNLNSSFTINCWVKISPTAPSSSGKGIVGKYTGNTANRSYLLFYDGINNLTTFAISTDGTNTPSTFKSINSSALLKNIWYNITAIFRASSSLEIYINGTLNSSDTTSFSTIYSSSNQPLTIGAQAIDSGGFNFQGSIATTQIYNRALTPSEITQNFNALRGRYGI